MIIITLRNFIWKYIFGKIYVIEKNNNFTYLPISLPFLTKFAFDLFKYNYIYKIDSLYLYSRRCERLCPPLTRFMINNTNYKTEINKYQKNIPFKVIRRLEKMPQFINVSIGIINLGNLRINGSQFFNIIDMEMSFSSLL